MELGDIEVPMGLMVGIHLLLRKVPFCLIKLYQSFLEILQSAVRVRLIAGKKYKVNGMSHHFEMVWAI